MSLSGLKGQAQCTLGAKGMEVESGHHVWVLNVVFSRVM